MVIVFLTSITVLILLVGFHGFFSTQLLTDSFQNLDDYEQTVKIASEVSSYAKRAEGHLFLYLTLGNNTDLEKFSIRHNSLNEQISLLENGINSFAINEQVNSLKSLSAEMLDYGNQIIEVYAENPEAFDFQEHSELLLSFHDATSGARRAGVNIVDLKSSELNQNIVAAAESGEALQRGIIAVTMIFVTVAPTCGFLVSRSITVPLKKLIFTTNEIAEGKLGLQSDIKLKNEIGDLADSFNKMSLKLKENQKQLITAERQAATQTATWVGHDLRNPLQTIQTSVYCINKQVLGLPESSVTRKKVAPFLQHIESSINYAEKIVRNLKDFGSDHKPDFEKTDINLIIKNALSQVDKPENVEIIENLEQIPALDIDKVMIERVFMNLITNALQVMENQGKLHVTTRKKSGFVEAIFQDTGCGMSKELLDKIFEPFFTTKAKGMGVGLSICKSFIEKNGGNIVVKSNLGKGSTFTVFLPI